MKKKVNYNEKKFCAEKIDFWATAQVYCKARQLGWARLLGVQALGARGARRQACVGARARTQVGAGARRRQGRKGAGARVAGGRQARGRWQARGHGRTLKQAWRAQQADAG